MFRDRRKTKDTRAELENVVSSEARAQRNWKRGKSKLVAAGSISAGGGGNDVTVQAAGPAMSLGAEPAPRNRNGNGNGNGSSGVRGGGGYSGSSQASSQDGSELSFDRAPGGNGVGSQQALQGGAVTTAGLSQLLDEKFAVMQEVVMQEIQDEMRVRFATLESKLLAAMAGQQGESGGGDRRGGLLPPQSAAAYEPRP